MASPPRKKSRAARSSSIRTAAKTTRRANRIRRIARSARSKPTRSTNPTVTTRVTRVEILWSENSAVPTQTFPTLAATDAALARAFAETPPPADGAYDKTAFVVAWSDGKRHEGRADIRAVDVANAPAAGGLLRQHLQIVGAAMRDASRTRWPWLTPEREQETNEWGTELLRRLAVEPPLAALPRNAPTLRDRRLLADHDPLRNGRLAFRAVGERGDPYPDWVQDLRGRSGVYVIRERQSDGSSPIVYVGESHTDRLHETLTRHFQSWRRYKGFWRGQYAEGHDPGLTYDRDAVDAAVVTTPADRAHEMESRFIQHLRPRDNLLGQPEEEVPF